MAKRRILIIDDEAPFTRLVRAFLEGTGAFEVREENAAARALAAARQFRPDLILLDVVMPDLSGAEVAAQLDADGDLARVPIVFLTAAVSKGVADHGDALAGRARLGKPVSLERVLETIREQLGS